MPTAPRPAWPGTLKALLRLAAWLTLATAGACSASPCDTLRERLCSAGGPEVCAAVERLGPMASDGHKKACAAVLSDPATFERQLQVLAARR